MFSGTICERSGRPSVRDAAAEIAHDFQQRGATPGEAQQYAGIVLGASVKLELTARGVSGGLRFLSVMTGMLGLALATLHWLAPSQPLRAVTK